MSDLDNFGYDPDRIQTEVRESVDVLTLGNGWYIAEGGYNGREAAQQGESREEVIDKLVPHFTTQERRIAHRERNHAHHEQRETLYDELYSE